MKPWDIDDNWPSLDVDDLRPPMDHEPQLSSYREGWWTTRDGRQMAIKEMETSHIINTMAYLWRVGTLEQIANGGKINNFYQIKIHELSRELQVRITLVKAEAAARGKKCPLSSFSQ